MDASMKLEGFYFEKLKNLWKSNCKSCFHEFISSISFTEDKVEHKLKMFLLYDEEKLDDVIIIIIINIRNLFNLKIVTLIVFCRINI